VAHALGGRNRGPSILRGPEWQTPHVSILAPSQPSRVDNLLPPLLLLLSLKPLRDDLA
jgi:hypothetical protein